MNKKAINQSCFQVCTLLAGNLVHYENEYAFVARQVYSTSSALGVMSGDDGHQGPPRNYVSCSWSAAGGH